MSSVNNTTTTKKMPSIAGITYAPATSSIEPVKVLSLKTLKKQAKTGSLSLPELALEELKKLWDESLEDDIGYQMPPKTKITVQALYRACIGHIAWEHYKELSGKVWYLYLHWRMPREYLPLFVRHLNCQC